MTRAIYLRPWRVDVTVRDGVPGVSPSSVLARCVAAALVAASAPAPASIGLILSDDAELAELNALHMGKDVPTDVLSFPLLPPDAFQPHPGGKVGPSTLIPGRGVATATGFALPPGRRLHLGDIVVSVERAIEQADAGRGGHSGDVRWSPMDELRLLVTHGTLHICGWDHAEPLEEAAMRSLETALLRGRPKLRGRPISPAVHGAGEAGT